MKKYLLILIGSLLAFISCYGEIDEQMLIGKYIANHQKADDILVINPDGTYDYKYTTSDGVEFTNTNV